MKPSAKLIWVSQTDLKKIFRERRTIALIILLPVIVVVVVGTTFSLGYQEFEARELAVGVIGHGNSSYADMIIDAVEDQNAEAILYETVDDAREDLMTERIDTIIEVDPWIDEKFVDLKNGPVPRRQGQARYATPG